jgi:hypothetical protein
VSRPPAFSAEKKGGSHPGDFFGPEVLHGLVVQLFQLGGATAGCERSGNVGPKTT